MISTHPPGHVIVRSHVVDLEARLTRTLSRADPARQSGERPKRHMTFVDVRSTERRMRQPIALRREVSTGPHLQLVLMSLEPGDEIAAESPRTPTTSAASKRVTATS
jgi:hypothetical protein